jgi:putative transcriptional regulator
MNVSIRRLLKMTQGQLAKHLGMSQANISNYERGQPVPPDVAAKLIELARSQGKELTYDNIYDLRPVVSISETDCPINP